LFKDLFLKDYNSSILKELICTANAVSRHIDVNGLTNKNKQFLAKYIGDHIIVTSRDSIMTISGLPQELSGIIDQYHTVSRKIKYDNLFVKYTERTLDLEYKSSLIYDIPYVYRVNYHKIIDNSKSEYDWDFSEPYWEIPNMNVVVVDFLGLMMDQADINILPYFDYPIMDLIIYNIPATWYNLNPVFISKSKKEKKILKNKLEHPYGENVKLEPLMMSLSLNKSDDIAIEGCSFSSKEATIMFYPYKNGNNCIVRLEVTIYHSNCKKIGKWVKRYRNNIKSKSDNSNISYVQNYWFSMEEKIF
jgi:hypothetical protein